MMRELSISERKKIGLCILSDMDEICRKYDIHYFLAYGTLLGAIRHKGFIPWDDDIDIWVPINQYKKLLDVLEKESKYTVINHLTDNKVIRTFSKLSDSNTLIVDGTELSEKSTKRGVAVDIFPLFRCSTKGRKIIKIKQCVKMIDWIFKSQENLELGKISLIKKILVKYCVAHNMDMAYWKNKMYNLQLNDSHENIGCVLSPYGVKDSHSPKDFYASEMIQFEEKEFPAPGGWDNILTTIYGDYMKLPPKEKRVSNHNVKAYIIEE